MVLELESLNIKTTELQIAVVRLPEVFLEKSISPASPTILFVQNTRKSV